MNILDALNKGFNTLNNVENKIRSVENNTNYTMRNTTEMVKNMPGVHTQTTPHWHSSPTNTEYSTNYNALRQSDEQLQRILPEDSNQGLYEKLSHLNQDMEKVLSHPTPTSVNGMARELGVGTFSNAPGFHLNGYLNNLQAQINNNPVNDAQNVVSSLER